MMHVEDAVILTPEEFEALNKAAKRQKRGRRVKRSPIKMLRSITAFLFVTSQVAALFWVSTSYAIAVYSTVKLAQPFPVETLSEQAIIVLIGVLASKVVENIFEHNEGVVWGCSKKETGPASDNTESF